MDMTQIDLEMLLQNPHGYEPNAYREELERRWQDASPRDQRRISRQLDQLEAIFG